MLSIDEHRYDYLLLEKRDSSRKSNREMVL